MATVSTLCYGRLWVWPIVMIVTEVAEKILTTLGFLCCIGKLDQVFIS